ncbi:hypothetical protein [Kitasatospora albolonga]|uniref:hypothetical protein n=1 Tax=Kitasatospora albolonga TaxID=68173 RepID=UPI003CD091C2
MARAAIELGHQWAVLTDHSPRPHRRARPERRAALRQQLDVVAGLNETLAPFRLLTGIECDILDDGSLTRRTNSWTGWTWVVGSVHSKLRMDPLPMTRRLLAAVRNPRMDVLGHCTGRLVGSRTRPESRFDAEKVFAACAESGHRRRDQLPPRAPGSAVAADRARGRGRVPLLDRHRRARPRPARPGSPTAATGRPPPGSPPNGSSPPGRSVNSSTGAG